MGECIHAKYGQGLLVGQPKSTKKKQGASGMDVDITLFFMELDGFFMTTLTLRNVADVRVLTYICDPDPIDSDPQIAGEKWKISASGLKGEDQAGTPLFFTQTRDGARMEKQLRRWANSFVHKVMAIDRKRTPRKLMCVCMW